MRVISTLLVMAVAVGSATLWAADGFLPGSGTEGDPYLIEDLADFDEFADPVNSATYWASGVYTKLACDPNLADRTYSTAVIAPDTDNTSDYYNGTPFEGIFDGDGHAIGNLTIDTDGEDEDNDYLGLFGQILGSSAEVKNLGMENSNIIGAEWGMLGEWEASVYIGGLCAVNGDNSGGSATPGGTITNCYFDGSIEGGAYIGGLCGITLKGSISNCYAGGSVHGGYDIGGLCGYNGRGIITDCHFSGDVSGKSSVGGLCGGTFEGSISNCSSGGSVYGWEFIGGLCGENRGGITNCNFGGVVSGDDREGMEGLGASRLGGLCGISYGTISNCYATGEVNGGELSLILGGLCGENFMGIITDCYATSVVSVGGQGEGPSSSSLGGLCGRNMEGTINNCYATGAVSGAEDSHGLGGLCGSNSGTVNNCYAGGAVTGGDSSYGLGGLCGRNHYDGTIRNCYAGGAVTGGDSSYDLGGLCGGNDGSTITNCFWDVASGGMDNGVGIPLSTAEMQTGSTFIDAGWDLIETWRMCVDGVEYPRLVWQFGSDYSCPDGVAIEDVLYLATHWLETGGEPYTAADRTGDGIVDLEEYALLAEQWMRQ